MINHTCFSSLLILTFASLSFFSCTVKAEITIQEPGGKTSATLKTDPAVLKYWKDLADLDSQLPPSPLDKNAFQKMLTEKSHGPAAPLASPEIKEPQAGMVSLGFQVKDWEELQKGLPPLLSIKKNSEGSELTLRLDRKTFRQLTNLTAYGQSPALASLIPEENAQVTTADYRDLLVYLLEPYDPQAARIVDQSSVELRLNFPRPVKRVTGAQSYQDRTVVCRWPLAQVLALEKPLTVSVIY